MEEKDVYFNVLFGNIYIYKIKTDLIYISFELKHKTDQFLFPQHTKQLSLSHLKGCYNYLMLKRAGWL